MKSIPFVILVLCCNNLYAQNLIPNGDFEQYYGCPSGYSQLDSSYFWHSPTTNQNNTGTPDYFNQCATGGSGVSIPVNDLGFQFAHSGVAYSGIHLRWGYGPNYREYIESIISQPLIAGNCYHFEMYVSLGDVSQLSSHNIGVYFSDTAVNGITNYYPLPFIPQITNTQGNYFDSLNWRLVSGNYIAHGGETHIIIGNFQPDSLTDTIMVNPPGPYLWSVYCYIDDVSLTVCTGVNENEHSKKEAEVYPNPVHDAINIRSTFNFKAAEFTLFDASGRKVINKKINKASSFCVKELKEGIYFYEIKDDKGKAVRGKVMKE